MDKPPQSLVLVTGSTGYLGSWLVRRLLEKGYRVRAAVLDPNDKHDLEPLLALAPSFGKRLEIVKADLGVEGDFDKAAQGCDGVFHLACAVAISAEDPQEILYTQSSYCVEAIFDVVQGLFGSQKDVIDPAVHGTLNVLNACAKASSVKRVIHVSSMVAIKFTGKEKAGQVFDESCWTDVDFCIQNKVPAWPYLVGKTLGEKTATEFGKKHNLDVVVANPSIVVGPFLLSCIPLSVKEVILPLITGAKDYLHFLACMPYVHTEDVVQAFIFLYENPNASGRYICSAVDASIREVAKIIHSHYQEFKVPTDLDYLGELALQHLDSSKLKRLGFEFKYTLNDMFCDAIDCSKEKGLLKDVESTPQ